jgi:predicted small integral membrane protein
VRWGDVDWIGLSQDRDRWRALVNAVFNLRVVGGKARGKRPLRRPRRGWLDNIRMDLVEVGWGDVEWIGLAQDRDTWRALVNSVMNLRVP